MSNEEVKDAMFSMDNGKALGPNGFRVYFFKKAWSVIGKRVTKIIQNFFKSEFFLKELNCFIISLIPKCPNISFCKDYRPISCCSTIYKCITKILANRLKDILPYFIGNAQMAFVVGSKIGDNILLCQ